MSSINPNAILQSLLQEKSVNSGASQQSRNPSITDAFAAVNGQNADPTHVDFGNSYLMDLSPAARAYLQNTGGAASNSSTTSSTGAGVVLSFEQQKKLQAILEKYKDAPYNDETFAKIQHEMKAAGLDAESLAAQSQMRNLNPTAMLLNALGGGDGSVGSIGGSTDIKNIAKGFMKNVAEQWTRMSSTAADAINAANAKDEA